MSEDQYGITRQAEAGGQVERLGEWLPIESAPKDERHILAWNGDAMTVVQWFKSESYPGWWSLAETGGHCDDGEFYGATHWMPLPEPPR